MTRFTKVGYFIVLLIVFAFIVSIIIRNHVLTVSSFMLTTYLTYAMIMGLYSTSKRNFEVKFPKEYSIVAGKTGDINIRIKCRKPVILKFNVENPVVNVKPKSEFKLKGSLDLKFTIKPMLSGPSNLVLKLIVHDERLIIKREMELANIKLNVIPRARFALWLITEFMGKGAGEVPSYGKPLRPFRAGLEYYGTREFVSGDTPRLIDWKKTVKFHKLLIKEFGGAYEPPVFLVLNLKASDYEEADKLAYLFLTTALTLTIKGYSVGIITFKDNDVVRIFMFKRGVDVLENAIKAIGEISVGDYGRITNPYALMKYEYYTLSKDLGNLRENVFKKLCKKHPLHILEKQSNIAISFISDYKVLTQTDVLVKEIFAKQGIDFRILTTKEIP